MDVSSHAAIASGGTCLWARYWLKLWFCWLQERPGSRPQQRKHCTPTAATMPVPAPQSSHLKFNTTGPIPPYSSNQWPALWRGDTAVCWEEGDRWETGIAVYVSVWVSVSEGWEGGWLKGGRTSQARLQSYWHAESHIWWAENSAYRHAEVGAFQRASDSRLRRRWDPENTDFTAHHSRSPLPCFSRDPVPIYLIRASALLSGRRLIFAGTQERRQCHRRVRPRAGEAFGVKVKRISNILCVITSRLLWRCECRHESARGSIMHWQHNALWVHELWVSQEE